MNNTICLATVQLVFCVVVGGGKSHVFTIQIRTPQDKGSRDTEVKSASHFSLKICNVNIRGRHLHLVVNRMAGQLVKCGALKVRVI